MNNQVIYIVTHYGCNSTPSDMWIPCSRLYMNYDEAYAYFLHVAPSLDENDCKAEKYINPAYLVHGTARDYTIIENRVQLAGHAFDEDDEDDCNYAKRPEGAVIAQYILKH